MTKPYLHDLVVTAGSGNSNLRENLPKVKEIYTGLRKVPHPQK